MRDTHWLNSCRLIVLILIILEVLYENDEKDNMSDKEAVLILIILEVLYEL